MNVMNKGISKGIFLNSRRTIRREERNEAHITKEVELEKKKSKEEDLYYD